CGGADPSGHSVVRDLPPARDSRGWLVCIPAGVQAHSRSHEDGLRASALPQSSVRKAVVRNRRGRSPRPFWWPNPSRDAPRAEEMSMHEESRTGLTPGPVKERSASATPSPLVTEDVRPDQRASLLAKIATKKARVGVIGLGYVGLPLARAFA